MRGAIVGLAIACAVGAGGLVYGRMAATTQDSGEDWRQHRLAFIKSAYDRVQVDLARSAAGGAAWRGEADTILQAMAEVAKPMPADSVPSDIRVLFLASAPPEQNALAAPIEAVAIERSVEVAAESALVEPMPDRPIAQPQLSSSPTAIAAVLAPDKASAAEPPFAVAAEPESSATSPETPSGPVILEATSVGEQPEPSLAASDAPRTLSQLEAALHAEKTDRGLRVILPSDSLFSSIRDALDPAADPPLSSLAELIVAMAPREIVVIDHTDPSGEDAANLTLSKKRAHAVVAWLGAHVEHQPHFVERGYGRNRPIAPNKNADGSDNTEGHQQNRRIEILLRRN
jgi:outer membrane protein OmpA-like peptidoglycan-associated protein